MKVILFYNHHLGMVQLEQEAAGLRVEDPAEVRAALDRALGSTGPVLLDVATEPNVLSMPPKATIQQAAGFALAMTRMSFTGELGDVLDTVAAN